MLVNTGLVTGGATAIQSFLPSIVCSTVCMTLHNIMSHNGQWAKVFENKMLVLLSLSGNCQARPYLE